MKTTGILSIFLIAILISQSCGNSSQTDRDKRSLNPNVTGTPVIRFEEYEHNFGKIVEGEKVGYLFTFENNGTGDLVIISVTTSCGCTVSKYNLNPISPGKKGTLEVIFNTSGRNGIQSKIVTVKSNASNPVVLLKITAEVITS
jgi:hypothetical protein